MSEETHTRRLVLDHEMGLHNRPCLAIVKTARRFRSSVTVRYEDRIADATQILQLGMLGAPNGAELTLSAAGPDAAEALDALEELFQNDFGMGGP